MSLYAAYIKEREDKEIVEDERGFATYFFTGPYCYIVDIYVHPDFRRQKIGSYYADKIADIARGEGYKLLLGSVAISKLGATDSLRALLAYGFKLCNMDRDSDPELIYLTKEI